VVKLGAIELQKRYARQVATEVEIEIVEEVSPEVRRAREDFGFFRSYLTRNQARPLHPVAHQLEWDEQLITNEDSQCLKRIGGVTRLSILAPRGSSKSTCLGLFVAWAIGIHALEKMLLPVMYVSVNIDIARAKSAAIKNIIASEAYQEIFPCVRPGKKWADDHWEIDYGFAGIDILGQDAYTLIAIGMKGAIAGKRAAIVIFDDIIRSFDDIDNPDVRAQMIRTWNQVIKPLVFEGGRFISLNTRYRPDDIFATEFIEEKGWRVIEQQALILDKETGEERSYWEAMWSKEFLEGYRREDPYSFSYQYQNKIMKIEGFGIDRESIQYGVPPENLLTFVVGIDLASSIKEKADYTVITLAAKDEEGRFWFLDYRMGKWTGNLDKMDIILELYEDWRVDDGMGGDAIVWKFYGEAVAYQASLKGDWDAYIRGSVEDGGKGMTHLHFWECKPKGDKLARIVSVTGVYANKRVWYNQFVDWTEHVKQLVEFGATAHDDAMDSQVICLHGLGGARRLNAATDIWEERERLNSNESIAI
jgi:predicted phage terminase large subunit-like protein